MRCVSAVSIYEECSANNGMENYMFQRNLALLSLSRNAHEDASSTSFLRCKHIVAKEGSKEVHDFRRVTVHVDILADSNLYMIFVLIQQFVLHSLSYIHLLTNVLISRGSKYGV